MIDPAYVSVAMILPAVVGVVTVAIVVVLALDMSIGRWRARHAIHKYWMRATGKAPGHWASTKNGEK
jgi:hypothetical protein